MDVRRTPIIVLPFLKRTYLQMSAPLCGAFFFSRTKKDSRIAPGKDGLSGKDSFSLLLRQLVMVEEVVEFDHLLYKVDILIQLWV